MQSMFGSVSARVLAGDVLATIILTGVVLVPFILMLATLIDTWQSERSPGGKLVWSVVQVCGLPIGPYLYGLFAADADLLATASRWALFPFFLSCLLLGVAAFAQ